MSSLLTGAVLLLATPVSRALDGSWNITGNNGNWGTPGNWTNSQIADGTDFTAFFINNISQDRTVVVDAGRIIGNLIISDPSGSQNRTFTGGPLILSTTSLKPQIRVTAGALVTTFNVEIQGVNGLRKEQANTVVLGVSNSWTGDTDINRGTLRLGHANAIPSGPGMGNVNLQVAGGNPVLDIGSVNPTINGLNSTSAVAIVNSSSGAGLSTLSVGAGDANGEFGGVIANGANRTVGLTKIGAGTQSLTNINTYTGPTTIAGGTLKLIGDGSISSSATISLAGGTLDLASLTTTPYSITSGQTLSGMGGTGTIEGSVTLDSGAWLAFNHTAGTPNINVASGTLTLNGNATTINVAGNPMPDGSYKLISKSGGGSVDGTVGTATIGGLGIIGGGTPNLAVLGGELFLNVTGGATVLEWGSGNGTWAVGTAGWNSGGGTTFANGNATLFADRFSTGSPTITLDSEVQPQGVFVSSTNDYTISGSGAIGGAADIRKLGSGALTLDVANTYTGGTILFEGTLNLKNAAALGAAAGVFTIAGGTIDNTSGSALTLPDHPQAWNGNFTFTGSSSLNLGAGSVTLNGTRTVTVNSSTLTVGGGISSSSFGIVKNGTGTLELNGVVDTGASGMSINSGTLKLGGDNTFTGTLTINDGAVILENDGALNLTSPVAVAFQTDTDVKSLSLNGHSVTVRNLAMGIIAGGGVTVVQNNHATTPVTLTVDVSSGSVQYAASLADGAAAPLALTKTGSGNWTFGGGGVGSGTYSGDTTILAGTITAGANNILPFGPGKGNLIVSGTLDILDRSAMSLNGLSGNGTVNRSNPGGAANSTLTLGNADANGTFTGRIRNTGSGATLHLVKTGTGTQIFAGVNDYTGTTTINDGVLQIGNGTASGSLTSPSIVNNTSLVYNRGGSMPAYAGVISGPGTVVKDGPGIVPLTGANTYTGTTTVQGGTLQINSPGSLAVESTVTVKSGGTIGGTGTINGPVTVEAGGTLAPGASIGTLTINNTLSLGGTTVMEVSRDNGFAESDLLNLGALALNYGGELIVTNSGVTSLRSGDSFNLFDAATINPGFTSVALPPLLPGLSWSTNLNADGTISISGTVIPPTLNAPVVTDTTVTLSGTGGVAGGTYYVLTSTDVTAPLENWVPFSTNLFDVSGNFSLQDAVVPEVPERFYRIVIP